MTSSLTSPHLAARTLDPVVVPVLFVLLWAATLAPIGASGGRLGSGLGFSADPPKIGGPQVAALVPVINQHLFRPFLGGDFNTAVRLHPAGFDKIANCGVVGIVRIKPAADVRGYHQEAGVEVEFANFLFHVGLSGLAYSNPFADTITQRLGICQAAKGPHRHNVRGQGTRHFVEGTLDPLVGILFFHTGIERETIHPPIQSTFRWGELTLSLLNMRLTRVEE